MFLRILDPDQGPLVQGTDPAPDPCIIKQKKFLPLYESIFEAKTLRNKNIFSCHLAGH
jgi:hypothetical protein